MVSNCLKLALELMQGRGMWLGELEVRAQEGVAIGIQALDCSVCMSKIWAHRHADCYLKG